MRYRRTIKSLWKLILVFALMTVAGYYLAAQIYNPCSNKEGQQALRILCDDFLNRNTTGDLCEELCLSQKLRFTACIQTFPKKHVYLAEYRGSLVVMKSKYTQVSRAPLSFTQKQKGTVVYPDYGRFVKKVQDLVAGKLGKEVGSSREKLFDRLGISDTMLSISTSQDIKYKQAVMRTLWSLLSQDEYLTLIHLRSGAFVPKVYGSCGPFYVMEYVGPAAVLHPPPNFGERRLPEVAYSEQWHFRAGIALRMMNLVRTMRTEFGEELHHCDIKSTNFGLTVNHTLKTVDVDHLYLDRNLRKRLKTSHTVCKDHGSCSIFTCKGWCDSSTKKCLGKRTNNNLQAVCEMVFKDHEWNTYQGLLRTPPASIASKVKQLLDECSNPHSYNSSEAGLDTRFAASQGSFDQLYEVLSRSLA